MANAQTPAASASPSTVVANVISAAALAPHLHNATSQTGATATSKGDGDSSANREEVLRWTDVHNSTHV